MGKNSNKYSSGYIRRRRRMRWIISIVVLLVLFVGALFYRAMLSLPYESMDLCNLAIIDFGGYNTAGTAEVLVDDMAVDALLANLKSDYEEAKVHTTEPNDEDYLKFRQSLQFSLDKTEGLSNGSVVTINCEYDRQLAKILKLEVTNISRQITVGGLPTVTKLTADQLFEDLELTFTGVSPNLTIHMKNNSNNPLISKMGFEIIDAKENYAAGDTVVVKANYSEEMMAQTQYIVDADPSECVHEYVATSDAEYVRYSSDLPSYIIDEAVAAGRGAFTDANAYGVRIFCEAHLVPVYINKKATFNYGTPNFVSAYFKTVFPEKAGNISYDYNDLDIIYSVVITQADGVACTAYAAVRFSNIIKHDDGTYEYDFSNPTILSESYYSSRVVKNVTDSYVMSHDVERVR